MSSPNASVMRHVARAQQALFNLMQEVRSTASGALLTRAESVPTITRLCESMLDVADALGCVGRACGNKHPESQVSVALARNSLLLFMHEADGMLTGAIAPCLPGLCAPLMNLASQLVSIEQEWSGATDPTSNTPRRRKVRGPSHLRLLQVETGGA